MMMILLSLLLPHQIISFTYYKINPIDNSSGIFYNHLGTARISNNKLTLLSHLHLTFLDEAWNILTKSYEKSSTLCTLALKNRKEYNHVNFYCERSLSHINTQLKEIHRKQDIIHYYLLRI